jgi:glutathione peroxidase
VSIGISGPATVLLAGAAGPGWAATDCDPYANRNPDCEDIDVTLRDIPVNTLDGQPSSLAELDGKTLLVVNVASKCGLTPQYTGLEELQKQFGDRGFSVVGFPCNQFGGQEPGSAEEIAEFCSTTYGVSFPMFEKIDVNGPGRHPIYTELTATADAEGAAGDIQWNFEKFLVGPDGTILARFRPMTTPDAPELVSAIEANLPGA